GGGGGGTGGGGLIGGPKRVRLRIAIAGVPSRCVAGSFTARVSVTASRGLRRARAYLDRRSVRRSTGKRFSIRVALSGLRRGKHRLTVMAVDRKGKRSRRTAIVRRC